MVSQNNGVSSRERRPLSPARSDTQVGPRCARALHRRAQAVSLTETTAPVSYDQRTGQAAAMAALYGRMRSIGEAGR